MIYSVEVILCSSRHRSRHETWQTHRVLAENHQIALDLRNFCSSLPSGFGHVLLGKGTPMCPESDPCSWEAMGARGKASCEQSWWDGGFGLKTRGFMSE